MQTWLTIALVIKHFDGTRWKKQLHKTCDEKQKLTRNDKAAWHDFFSNCENTCYHTRRSTFCGKFEKNIQRNKT